MINPINASAKQVVSSFVKEWIDNILEPLGIVIDPYNTTYLVTTLALLFVTALLSLVLLKLILNRHITRWMLGKLKNWDHSLHANKLFSRIAHLLPAFVIAAGAYSLYPVNSFTYEVLIKLSKLYIFIVGLGVIFSIFNTGEHLYSQSPLAKKASITGFIQIGKLFFSIVTLLLCISIVIEKSPFLLLSGLTAIAAVLLLIFRDTILGLVAGIQIAANRMFNTGDWIVMEKFNVDGEIREIGLTNVKVQNWDNTISTFPTFSLTNEAVKNWRGMSQSGGRRIKRSIYIDIYSVRLCDKEMLETLSNIKHISEYLQSKQKELEHYHVQNNIDQQDLLNSRKLTNIGTFRAYINAYLKSHPLLNQTMTTMVRHLPPSELGIALEVYCFTKEKRWVEYEKIQADIFDHIMAMLPVFNLRAYQRDASPLSSQNAN